MKIETPQEVEVWYLIPALRRGLMSEMLKAGVRKKDVAGHLNVTKSAVSQYLTNKRAGDVVFDKEIKKEIKSSATRLIRKETDIHAEIQRLLHFISDKLFLCKVCRTRTGSGKTCRVCYK
jgi:predicted transcriptional regulator